MWTVLAARPPPPPQEPPAGLEHAEVALRGRACARDDHGVGPDHGETAGRPRGAGMLCLHEICRISVNVLQQEALVLQVGSLIWFGFWCLGSFTFHLKSEFLWYTMYFFNMVL